MILCLQTLIYILYYNKTRSDLHGEKNVFHETFVR